MADPRQTIDEKPYLKYEKSLNSIAFLKYSETGAIPYREGGFVKRVNNCNGYRAINTGDTTVFVNDQILYPGVIGVSIGDSVTTGGNYGEIFMGSIKISFGAGANPEVTINQKHYILPNNEQIV